MATDCSAIEIEDGGSETCWGAAARRARFSGSYSGPDAFCEEPRSTY